MILLLEIFNALIRSFRVGDNKFFIGFAQLVLQFTNNVLHLGDLCH